MEHTDLENYNNSEENLKTNFFRNRPAPIVINNKKNNDEVGTEMKTEQMIEHTSTETANVTLKGIQSDAVTATVSANQTQANATTVSTRPSCKPQKLGKNGYF